MERTHSDYPDYRDIRLTDDVITLRSLREEDAEALLAGEDEENRNGSKAERQVRLNQRARGLKRLPV